ncbi:IS3 family transposase [Cohaesibacter celericrescens]
MSGPHDDKDKELAHIRSEHARNCRAYGRKRMTEELQEQGIVNGERRVGRLMQDKGNCYDNAVVETFFKSLKAGLIWRNQYETRERAQNDLFGYINGFYNPRRRHSYLCNISPVKFESMAA